MSKKLGVLFGALAIVAIGVAPACGDDETTSGSGATGTTRTTATTTTTTTTAGGGEGGSGAAGGEGGAGGAACKTCGEFIVNVATSTPDELCGYQSGGGMRPLVCDPGSSCELFAAAFTCACAVECTESCGDNACMGMAPSQPCLTCSGANCGAEFGACQMDM